MPPQSNQRIKEILIQKSDIILNALKQMDQVKVKLLIVTDNDKFYSLLSIGDIQRAIINNISLNTPVYEILRKNIRVANIADSIETIKESMLKYRSECMPVFDNSGSLVNILFWEDVFDERTKRNEVSLGLPVVIMAGGKGTRLKPLTNVLPKPLIPIGEKTMVEEIMDRFIEAGCNKFLLSVNFKADMIKHYFDNLLNKSYNIEYFQEDKPLGTAGSMYLIKDKIHSTFFVSNCDIIINQDLVDIYQYHKEMKNEITIVAALKHYPIPYGTIETKEGGELISLNEKPELTFMINSGMYLLEPHLLTEIPKHKFSHITHLIEKIKNRKGKVGVFPVSEKSWKDIGKWDNYFEMIKFGDNK